MPRDLLRHLPAYPRSFHRLASTQQMVDSRTGQALQMADSRLADATAQVAKVQADLHPVLANAADLTRIPRTPWMICTPTLRRPRNRPRWLSPRRPTLQKPCEMQLPRFGKSADAIAADVKREADSITKPKHWYEKILGPVYTVGKLVATFW